jgi:hypothetical protein
MAQQANRPLTESFSILILANGGATSDEPQRKLMQSPSGSDLRLYVSLSCIQAEFSIVRSWLLTQPANLQTLGAPGPSRSGTGESIPAGALTR